MARLCGRLPSRLLVVLINTRYINLIAHCQFSWANIPLFIIRDHELTKIEILTQHNTVIFSNNKEIFLQMAK